MKKKPVKYTGLSDEVDCNVPDYKTVIVISSQDQLNITLSKCGLAMLSNLGTVRAVLISTGSCGGAGGPQRSCFFLFARRLQRRPNRRLNPSRRTRLRSW